jgi:putative zinc finger/helix-turn-helix YgiT family protein
MNTKANLVHNCSSHLSRKRATADRPFLFTWSLLPDVYISGIHYEECNLCHKVAGCFPALSNLSETLTKTIIQKPSVLTGPEIRYLRKYLGKKNADFAQVIGVTPEQVSRWENGHNPPEKSADKLMRLLVADQMDLEGLGGIANLVYGPSGREVYLLSFRQKRWSGVCQPRV